MRIENTVLQGWGLALMQAECERDWNPFSAAAASQRERHAARQCAMSLTPLMTGKRVGAGVAKNRSSHSRGGEICGDDG